MNEFYEMLECFWKWAKMDPHNADVWYGIGIAFLKLGYYDYAARAFRKVLVIDPGNKSHGTTSERLTTRSGRHAEALEAYREAIKIDPDMAEAWSGLALTHVLSSNPVPVPRQFQMRASIRRWPICCPISWPGWNNYTSVNVLRTVIIPDIYACDAVVIHGRFLIFFCSPLPGHCVSSSEESAWYRWRRIARSVPPGRHSAG